LINNDSKKKRRRRRRKKKSSGNSSNGSNSKSHSSQNLSGDSEALAAPMSKITYGKRKNENDLNRKQIDFEARPLPPHPKKSSNTKKFKSDQNFNKIKANKIIPFQIEGENDKKKAGSQLSESSSALVERALMKRKLHVYYEFIEAALREDAVYEMTGISLNIFFMIRLVLLEFSMICFQTLPLTQVLSMNFINIAYFLWLIRAIFRDKVIESTYDIIHMFVLEIAIQIFLIMCIVFWLNKNQDFLNTVGSLIVQMICVLAVGTAVIYELLMLIFNLFRSIRGAYKRKKMMKEHVNGILAEIIGRRELTVSKAINQRGVSKMNRRMKGKFG